MDKRVSKQLRQSADRQQVDDRREHLRQYILACVRDSDLSWDDLAGLDLKCIRVLSKDIKAVLKDLGRETGAGLMQVGATMLGKFAEKLVMGKKR